jgi:two-component system cell cycle sensor histidine kinase/response regulator CckA
VSASTLETNPDIHPDTARCQRLERQLSALHELTALHAAPQKDWLSDLRAITHRAAEVMEVNRASIWRYNAEQTAIECLTLFDRDQQTYSSGMLLSEPDCPGYFASLKECDFIAATDAHSHPSTREFSTSYLAPHGIASMLDVPFHYNGATAGVLCFEQVGTPRSWDAQEIQFARTLAGLVSLAVETEQRKRIEAALQQSKNHYRAMVDNLPVLVCRWNREQILTYANAEYRNLLGGGQEVVGRSWTDFIPPDEVQRVLEIYPNQPETVRFESDVLTHQGERLTFTWMDAPILGVDGELLEYQSVGMDITPLRQRQQELRLLATALETTSAAVVITDPQGHIVWANPAFASTTGYELAETLGRTPTELLSAGMHGEAFYREMWQALSERGVWKGEFVNRRKDGTLYTDRSTLTSVRDSRGEVTHYVGIKEDVTERRHLEAQVAQAQKLESVARMAGLIGHDFNNMLAVILSHTDHLLVQEKLDAGLREVLRDIETAARRSAGLTSELLGFAQQQVVVARALDLNEAVEGMLTKLQASLGSEVKLLWKPAAERLQVKLDPGQLGQILCHLATNAREAQARTVTLEVASTWQPGADQGRRPGEYVRLVVCDDGGGMDEAVRSQVFEPFFTTKPAAQGRGLGLATVSGIVQQNGGTVALYSRPGKGTTVEVFLARSRDRQVTEAAPAPSPSPLPKGQGTVLLVEDEPALLRLNKRLLQRFGYTVLATDDPQKALEISRTYAGEIQLLLTDMLMPGMTGREVWQVLSQERPSMKCLFVSGYVASDFIMDGDQDRCDHLAKPFSPEGLQAKLHRLLH